MENAKPHSVSTARRVPIKLFGKVKEELTHLEKIRIIKKINEPTDWCAQMVPVQKKSGGVRICTDFKRLNVAVKCEHYILQSVEDIMHCLKEATIFSKLDATSGFFPIPLDEDS